MKALIFALFSLFCVSTLTAQEPIYLIMDGSGSMWGKVGDDYKIHVAKKVLSNLIREQSEDQAWGLVIYGHRKKSDCEDVELLASPGSSNTTELIASIDAVDPKGKTPLASAALITIDQIKKSRQKAKIILVSDGLESCGGNLCDVIKAAKEAGVEFTLHIVGFDMKDANKLELECAAQAGGGNYFDAMDEESLSDALEQAAETVEEEVFDASLSVKCIQDGELGDASVNVQDLRTGEWVTGGRTYTDPGTNPRIMQLNAGLYKVKVQPIKIRGDVIIYLDSIQIQPGEQVDTLVDFSSGFVEVEIRRNGELSDATVNLYRMEPREYVTGSRSYTSSSHNPVNMKVLPGKYEVIVKSTETSHEHKKTWYDIEVKPGETTSMTYEFTTGDLKVGAQKDGELIDAVVSIYEVDSQKPAGQGRTYTSDNSNPKSFRLIPGKYKAIVKTIKFGRLVKEEIFEVKKGETTRKMLQF